MVSSYSMLMSVREGISTKLRSLHQITELINLSYLSIYTRICRVSSCIEFQKYEYCAENIYKVHFKSEGWQLCWFIYY